jgi:hypothetical protein
VVEATADLIGDLAAADPSQVVTAFLWVAGEVLQHVGYADGLLMLLGEQLAALPAAALADVPRVPAPRETP